MHQYSYDKELYVDQDFMLVDNGKCGTRDTSSSWEGVKNVSTRHSPNAGDVFAFACRITEPTSHIGGQFLIGFHKKVSALELQSEENILYLHSALFH